MDLASLIGTFFGIGAILAGQLLEGGHVGQILQGTAAMIVVGGTIGAALVSYPTEDLVKAIKSIPLIYLKVDTDVRPLIEEIVRIATVARKEGVLAVEGQRESITNALFNKSLKFVIDGFEPATVREIIDTEIAMSFEEEEQAGRVFEAAGGYAPTIGIIGAVLGLIHVMSMLSDPSKIGEGIAVAFVATVYGVGLSNLILIPWGTKLKRKAAQRMLSKEVVKLGVVGIQEGLNPHFLQEKLEVFVEEHLRREKKHNDPVNHERWLVSYADFITLLFAFFVIMYAISQADIAKFKQVSKSLRAAFNTDGGPSGAIDQSGASGGKTANPFENPETPGGRAMDMPGGKANAASESDSELHDIRDLLEETVSLELGATDLSDKMLMVYDSQGLVIRLAAKDFFDEGSSEVKGDLRPLLDRIGQVVTSSKKSIRIEGHADPSEAHVKNTWTLSTERAAWVAKYWISRFNVDPKRIGIAGYGHFRPLSQSQSNKDSVWSRASNRRVEIIILKNQYPE